MKAEVNISHYSKFPIEVCGFGDEILLTRDEALDLYSQLEDAIHELADEDGR